MPKNRSREPFLGRLTMTFPILHCSLFKPYLSQKEMTVEEDSRIKMRKIEGKKYLGKKIKKK